jgi:hypothetical protein
MPAYAALARVHGVDRCLPIDSAVSPIGQASHRLAPAARSRCGNSCLLCLQILPSFQPVALFACAKFTPIGIFAGLWDGIELENTPA